MAEIADLIASSKKAIEERDAARTELTALKSKLGTTPNVIRRDAEGRPTSTFEEGDESAEIIFGRDDLRGPQATGITDPYAGNGGSRRKALRQHSRSIMKGLNQQGYGAWNEFKGFNDFVRSGLDGHTSPQFRERQMKHFKALKAVGMTDGIGSDGGFTVVPEFNLKIFERVYSNDLVSSTDNYSVGGNNMTFLANAETSRVDGSRHGGLRGYWTGEAQTITASKPTVREVVLKLQKCAVIVYLTDELIADTSIALEQYVARKASDEFNFVIGSGIFRGDGIGKPLGVLNAPSFLAVTPEVGQSSKTIVTENIVKAHGRFFHPFLSNAKWYHNQDCLQSLQLMGMNVGAVGGISTFMMPGMGLSMEPFQMLEGRPMQPIEFANTLGTQGDIVIADLSQMLSISKGGVNQAVSMHVEFLTDQTALRFTMRMNAIPWENAPTTPYQGTNTQSSFVGIGTR